MRSFLIPLLCIAAAAAGGEKGSNLRVLQGLGREIATELRGAAGPGMAVRPVLTVTPEQAGLYLQHDFAGAFADLPAGDRDSAGRLEVGIIEAHVVYEDIRRDGLFGPKVMDRVVTLGVRMRYAEGGAEPILGDFVRVSRDTVALDEQEGLELQGVPMTRGVLPPQGVWQGLLEPLILVGSIGVAVVLLFTIRS